MCPSFHMLLLAHVERWLFLALACWALCTDAGALTYKHLHSAWQYAPTVMCNDGGSLGRCGPAEWIQVEGSAECAIAGTQSPVDLRVDASLNADYAVDLKLTFHRNGSCCSGNFIINEHTSEVGVEETCPSTFYVTTPEGEVFHLHQLHFHSPSEHTWNGTYFPMEVHLVHVADSGQALVVSVMVGVGEQNERSKSFGEILNKMPPLPDLLYSENGTVLQNPNYVEGEVEFSDLDPYEIFVAEAPFLYHYMGSFTTPPCTTHTNWYMVTEPMLVTQEVLDTYRNQIQAAGNETQLAPWGVIVGEAADAVPPFHEQAGQLSWNTTLGSNNRPIQIFDGDVAQGREVRRTGALYTGTLAACEGEDDEFEIDWVLFFAAMAVCLVVSVALAAALIWCCPCKKAKPRTKRALKPKAAAAPPPPAAGAPSETVPLMLMQPTTPQASMPVMYAAPQMQQYPVMQPVVYATPPSQVVAPGYAVIPQGSVSMPVPTPQYG